MKKKYLILAVTLISISGIILSAEKFLNGKANFNANTEVKTLTNSVTIDDKTFIVEVAKTDTQKIQGLSGRKSLNENNGMLFVFSEPTNQPFWMKNMNFPLDFVWINNGIIVDITRNAPVPEKNTATEDLPTYSPKSPVNYVLEINAGTSNSFKIGDKAVINDSSSII